MTEHDMQIPPDKVLLILKRAAELDARGASVSVAELQAVAKEAGLDPLATESAIREVLASHTLPSVDQTGVTPLASATNGAVGLGLGLAAAAYKVGLPPALSLLGLSGALVFALYRVLSKKDRQDRSTILFENLITWAAFFIGATVLSGRAFPEVGILGGILWLATSTVAVFAPRRLREPGPSAVAVAGQPDSPADQVGAGEAFSDGV